MARKNKNAGSNDSNRKGKNRIFSGKTLDKATRARIEKQLAESRERDIRAMEEKNRRIAEKRKQKTQAKERKENQAKERKENRYQRIDDRDFRAKVWERFPHLALDKNAPKPDKMSDEEWTRYKEIQGIGELSHDQYMIIAERVDKKTMDRIREMPSEEVEEYFEYIAQNPLEDTLVKAEPFDPLSDYEQTNLDDVIQAYIDGYVKSL